ncbi:MAG: zinc transporter ZntB [Alphaproteobacteria bacterium]|nr:zinc transporter ZntB [Alphaproteobacteria bacterium]
MDDGIIHGCSIEGDGSGQNLEGKALSALIKDDKLAWVHLDANDPATEIWLKRELSYLDDIIIDALLEDETRPRILEFGEGVLMILRGVNLNENAQPEDMISIRLWIDKHRIISIQRRKLKAVGDIQALLMEGKGAKNSGDFVVMLLEHLFDRMEPVFLGLDEVLDDIEEDMVDGTAHDQRYVIANIRKQAIVFKRYITPQRDVIAQLRRDELEWLDDMHKRKLQEILDMIIRYIEDLDMLRERAQIIKDEISNIYADRMNRNMYVLSVIAAIFLPLGFLTGLLGINVGGIPGANNPAAFLIFCGILVALVIGQIALFKKMKWF